jgi:hypothetical protein
LPFAPSRCSNSSPLFSFDVRRWAFGVFFFAPPLQLFNPSTIQRDPPSSLLHSSLGVGHWALSVECFRFSSSFIRRSAFDVRRFLNTFRNAQETSVSSSPPHSPIRQSGRRLAVASSDPKNQALRLDSRYPRPTRFPLRRAARLPSRLAAQGRSPNKVPARLRPESTRKLHRQRHRRRHRVRPDERAARRCSFPRVSSFTTTNASSKAPSAPIPAPCSVTGSKPWPNKAPVPSRCGRMQLRSSKPNRQLLAIPKRQNTPR